ncbi:MAG: TetR/AcrR family transcriptional regulator [Hyphomicrobiales bacterium]|nr:TetR/AcrR family transcriptional regulator [Hyphomicrobiales bacterium]
MVEGKGREDADRAGEAENPFAATAVETGDDLRRAKRRAVLLTGARMFNERGYDRTTLDAIAAELQVSKRTLYYYIRNKDDILFQCNTMAYEFLQPTLEICADAKLPPLVRIRTLMRAYAQVLTQDYGACLVLIHENVLSRESFAVLREIRRRMDMTLRGLIEAGVADGSIAPCEPKYASAALFGAFNWLPHWRAAAKRPSYEEVGDAFLDTFLEGLRSKTER